MTISNSVISPNMILSAAMYLAQIGRLHEAPYKITAELELTIIDLIKSMDEFVEETLRPAIDAALARKRSLADQSRSFSKKSTIVLRSRDSEQITLEWEPTGVYGRLMRFYDHARDKTMTRIDVRVFGPSAADG